MDGLSSPSPLTSNSPSTSPIIEVQQLRLKGMDYLAKKNYKTAAKYYSATLQLMQGLAGEESGSLRRRCLLTLAECEIKSGKLHHAITTCTEIIDESPEVKVLYDQQSTDDTATPIYKLRQALGKAYYKRGVSLEKLNRSDLALQDFEMASTLLPDDRKISYRIGTLSIKPQPHPVVINDTSLMSDANTTTIREGSDIFEFVEYILQNYPRELLSKHEIKSLTEKRQSITPSTSSPFSSLMGGMTGQGQGIGGALGGLGGLGGLGSLMSGGLLGSVADIISLLASMSGMPPSTVAKIKDIASELMKMVQMYKSFFQSIINNRSAITFIITLSWVIGSILTYIRAKHFHNYAF